MTGIRTLATTLSMTLTATVLIGCVPAEPIAPPPAAGACNAAAVQPLVGRPHTPALGEQSRTASGARSLRTIRPGEMATMDYRPDRLNLRVGADGRIVQASCG